jgi:uncharacterized protein (TIGR03663 family)
MRIEARTSSGDGDAPADSLTPADQLRAWQARLAQVDWVPWMIVAFAALLRFFLLGIKPPHFDEGINGWFVDQMVKNGFYAYDPTNYHGPLHFYALFLSETLLGRNVWVLRLPVVIVSTLCVRLMFKFEPFVGRTAVRLAALAMAVSPGFVFYGRYSIHEVWLVFFSMFFILGFLGLWKFGTSKYLWCVGIGFAGMILTKETYIIHFGCAVLAACVCYLSNSFSRVLDSRSAKQNWSYVDLAVVAGVSIAFIVFFYSGTFLNWKGVTGIFSTYSAWFETGHDGHGHGKPFYYWLQLMAPSGQISRADFLGYELPALAGLVVCVFCLRFKDMSLRFLAIYGVGTLIAYSIVYYKTPWCIISFAWPFLFIFGAAAFAIPDRFRRLTNIVSAVLLLQSFASTIWLNYFHCTTDKEPYVYVQTYNDIYRLTEPVLALASRDPIFYMMIGHVIRPSSYPIPWMLGDFPHVGYYEHDNLPTQLDADFLVVQEDRIAEVETKLHDAYYTDWMTIRSYQDSSKIYFSAKVFKDFFSGKVPDFTGPKKP